MKALIWIRDILGLTAMIVCVTMLFWVFLMILVFKGFYNLVASGRDV